MIVENRTLKAAGNCSALQAHGRSEPDRPQGRRHRRGHDSHLLYRAVAFACCTAYMIANPVKPQS